MSHRDAGERPGGESASDPVRVRSRPRWKEPARCPLTQAQVDLLMQLLRQTRPRRLGRP